MENKELREAIKNLIKEEYKINKRLYNDKEEPVIGIKNGILTFFDGDFYKTTVINL